MPKGDGLARRGQRAGLQYPPRREEALYPHHQPLFGAVSIAFLDKTSLWFESAGGESLASTGIPKTTVGT